jgi:hypothetical protein
VGVLVRLVDAEGAEADAIEVDAAATAPSVHAEGDDDGAAGQLSKPSLVAQASGRATWLRTGPAWTPVSPVHQAGTEEGVLSSTRPLKLLLPAPLAPAVRGWHRSG